MEDEKILSLDIDGIKILEEDEFVSILSLDLLHVGDNRNSCCISEECVENSKNTIFNKPLIYKLNLLGTDVDDHNYSKFDTSMNICGMIPESSKMSFVEKNGKTYLRVHAVVYKQYQPKLIKILKNRGGNTKISIEIMPIEAEKREDGILNINKFNFLGVCLLGKNISEGIENSELNVIKYSENELNDRYIKFSQKYEVPMDITFAKTEWGTSPALKVNKSKEAMKTTSWGDVDKTALRNKILEASNYKSLVNDVYLVVENGWESHPSQSLKYPVMQISGDELVYNRHGISSALGYAKAENNSEATRKAEGLYKKLKLDETEDEKMSEKIVNKLDKDNPEIEKIRDDADSMEDNEKEKLKKNAEVDKPENDKLKDDVDADKDYWKKKANALEKECNALKNSLAVYAKKEEEETIKNMLKTYAHCFSDSEKKSFEEDMKKCSFAEAKEMITNKVMEYACKNSDDEDDDDKEDAMKNSMKFSVGFPVPTAEILVQDDGGDYKEISKKYKTRR